MTQSKESPFSVGYIKDMTFFTPEWFAKTDTKVESPHGRLLFASCKSGSYFAREVAKRYQDKLKEEDSKSDLSYLDEIDYRFSDGEVCVRLDRDVSGNDVFIFQALHNPLNNSSVDGNLIALLTAVRGFREWGANRITAVMPYLAYARQDKPTKFKREPTTAKLIADLLISAGIDRMITFDPHIDTIHGFFGHIPVNKIRSLKMFEWIFRHFYDKDEVIMVAPDAGASKNITYLGRKLSLKSAVTSKYRPQPEQAAIAEVIGDFRGKSIALVVDDMISTGGTIYTLAEKLVDEKEIDSVYVGVSHNLCLEEAYERMTELYDRGILRKLVVTNSVPQTKSFRELPFVEVFDLSDIFARVVNRIHYNRPLENLY